MNDDEETAQRLSITIALLYIVFLLAIGAAVWLIKG